MKDDTKLQIERRWPGVCSERNKLNSSFHDEFMDNDLVSSVKKAMEEKLELSRDNGRGGWWTKECSTEHLKRLLQDQIAKGDMCDVMNLAAMIYYREAAGITMNCDGWLSVNSGLPEDGDYQVKLIDQHGRLHEKKRRLKKGHWAGGIRPFDEGETVISYFKALNEDGGPTE